MYVSTQFNSSLHLLPTQMRASEFFDANLYKLSFNVSAFPIRAVYRSPRANPDEDDRHFIRALNFVSQLEPDVFMLAISPDKHLLCIYWL